VGSAGFTPEPLAQAQHQATALVAKMTLSQELTLMHGVSPGSTPDGVAWCVQQSRRAGVAWRYLASSPAGARARGAFLPCAPAGNWSPCQRPRFPSRG